MTEQLLKEMLTEIKGIKTDVSTLKEGQTSIVQRLDKLDNRVDNLEGQMKETNSIVQALRHNQEEMNAQIHNISYNLDTLTGKAATKEDISKIEAKIDVLNVRLFNQETDIQLLKKVK